MTSQPPGPFDAPHPASAYQPGMGYPGGPVYGQPTFPPPPLPPLQFDPIACSAPDLAAEQRYATALAAESGVMAAASTPMPTAGYDAAYAQLPQDRFYQFKMWLQSPEGKDYTDWEREARELLEVIEPFNARWAAGWLAAELEQIRPLVSWLQLFDTTTRQKLTYADHNPAARFALESRQRDPANPIPYDVLVERLAERDGYQQLLGEAETYWSDTFGVPLGNGWRSSWAPGDTDPLQIAPRLRFIIEQVTSRLWSISQLPQIPAVPTFAPEMPALPRNLSTLMQQIIALSGGDEREVITLPEPFEPPVAPLPLQPGPVRWSRGNFMLGRAVAVSARQDWAEGVAIQAGPTVQVQRYDGSVGYFAINDVRGAR